MKLRSNKIKDIFKYYSNDLDCLYEKEEIKNLMYLIFKEYTGLSRIDMVLNPKQTLNSLTIAIF